MKIERVYANDIHHKIYDQTHIHEQSCMDQP